MSIIAWQVAKEAVPDEQGKDPSKDQLKDDKCDNCGADLKAQKDKKGW